MIFNFQHQTAIVTGGGSGIGEAISRLFAAAGAQVYILDFNAGQAEKVAAEIRSAGGKAGAFTCDVGDVDSVKNAVDQIAARGPIHILVNNAGIAHVGNLERTSPEDLDRLYRVNVKGVYHCMQACIPYMKANGGGVILNMASVAALVGIPDRFAYSMTKGAVLAMTLSVAKDYLADRIRCNSISPARIHTPFVDGFIAKNYPGQEQEVFEKLSKTQPIGRMGTPEEVARLALFLCSDEAGFITGTDYPIDGGFVTLNN